MTRPLHHATAGEIDVTAADWVVRRNFGLSAQEERELAAWISADPRHARALQQNAQAWALLDRPRSAGHGEDIVRELAFRAQRRRRRRARAIAGSLGAVALLLAVWQGGPSTLEPRTTAAQVATGAVVRLPESRRLADGSRVDLRPGSHIDVDFTGADRRVILRRGTAHFEVAHNPLRPFVVRADNVSVRAVGTAFSVELSESNVEVLVTQGRVAVDEAAPSKEENASAALRRDADQARVSAMAGRPAEPPREFAAGSRIVVAASDARAPQASILSEADLTRRLAWRSPRVEFSDTPLAEAVELMNRHASVPIRIAHPALGRVRVNGLFRADNTDTFIELLELSFNVRATRAGNEIVLHQVDAPAGR